MIRVLSLFRGVDGAAPAGIPYRAGRAAALLALLCTFSHAARAQVDLDEEQEPNWIPSLSFRFDTFDYDTTAQAVNLLNPPAWEGSEDDRNRKLEYMVDGELMGPRIDALPGRPRLFAKAGLQFHGDSNTDIFRVGDLRGDTELDIIQFQAFLRGDIRRGCLNFTPPTCSTAEPGDFEGQGTEITADFSNPGWYSSLGIAWSFPVGETLLFQVKPSLAYNGEKVDFRGRITTVIQEGFLEPNIPNFVVYRGVADGSATDHSVGPAIEVGLVLFRSLRPVRASLYADARFLWLVSDDTTSFGDSLASYEVRREDFGVRAGAGVRLSWVGFGAD